MNADSLPVLIAGIVAALLNTVIPPEKDSIDQLEDEQDIDKEAQLS